MSTTPPSSPLHLPPAVRQALDAALPAPVSLALALDHLLWLDGSLPAPLQEALEAGLAEVTATIDRPEHWEVEELAATPRDNREEHVRSAPGDRFASPELAGLLAARALEALPDDASASLHWAELCRLVAGRGSSPKHREWQTHALFLIANAHRALRNLDEAARWFDLATTENRAGSLRTLELRSERNKLLSSWHLDRRALEDAVTTATFSALQANLVGDRGRQGRAALVAGHIAYRLGRYREMVGHNRLAVECFEATGQTLLEAGARLNLAIAWSEAGMARAARGVLLRSRHLFDRFPDQTGLQLRRRWREAKIAAALDQTDEGIRGYWEALEGFIETDALRDALHVALELVVLLRLAREFEALRELADSVVPRLEREAPDYAAPELETVLRILTRATREPDTVPLNDVIRAADFFRTGALPGSDTD